MSDGGSGLANLAFDTSGRQAFVNQRFQILSAREPQVLELLIGKPGTVVSKKLVETHLFGRHQSSTNAIEVYIRRLRKKLVEGGASAPFLAPAITSSSRTGMTAVELFVYTTSSS
jgi:DNA-binding response OmpR family regulator